MEKRLLKELGQMVNDPPPGVRVNRSEIEHKLNEWVVELDGAKGSLYEGETFKLKFTFASTYPFDSPQVVFLPPSVPVHPHVYSNGHICLSILTDDWTPALSVQSVCLSIISMLSSSKRKERPPDNALYVRTCSSNPKKSSWFYHDDNV